MTFFGISIGGKRALRNMHHSRWGHWGISPRLDWLSSLAAAVVVCGSCALYGFFLYHKVSKEGGVNVVRPTPAFKAEVLMRLQNDVDMRATVHASSVYTAPVSDPYKPIVSAEVFVPVVAPIKVGVAVPRKKVVTKAKIRGNGGTAAALPTTSFFAPLPRGR